MVSAGLSQNPHYVNYKPDITKLSALGYQPRVSLDEGLSRTAQWYAEHFAGQRARL